MNTKKGGKIRFFIFKVKTGKLFTGVCLDFGIVIEGGTINELREELCRASLGYLETVIKEKLDDSLLNNRAEKKYFDLYEKLLKNELKEVEDKKPSNTKNLIDYCLDSMSIKNLSDLCYA